MSPPTPFMNMSVISCRVMIPWTRYMSPPTVSPRITDQKADAVPAPAMMSPSPVIQSRIGKLRTTIPTGTTMFRARGSTPSFTVTASASVATKGSAPSRSTLPSSRTRRSATAMGPNSSAVTAMIRETTSVSSP